MALKRLHETARRGEFATGIIYIEPDRDDFLTQLNMVDEPLATLPLEDRQVVEAKYLEGAPVREIAERLQTSEKAIESRLVRIRRKLKAELLEGLKHDE